MREVLASRGQGAFASSADALTSVAARRACTYVNPLPRARLSRADLETLFFIHGREFRRRSRSVAPYSKPLLEYGWLGSAYSKSLLE